MASTENSGTATNVCSDCHIGTLASEHTTTGPVGSTVKVGCTTGGYAGNTAGCHNTTTGAIAPSSAAMVKNNWNSGTKLCSDCHPPSTTLIATGHTGSSTAGCGASGAGCHTTYDLRRCTGTARAAAAAGSPVATIRPPRACVRPPRPAARRRVVT